MTITPNKWELDVQGFLNTCNITAATPRKQIRDFSAGVNDLGLWNSMVCWPLRSSQNYGSGTTAFSLGGLGTFNGTLTNGPSWGADGITNSATGHITTNYFEVGGSQAHIFVGNTSVADGATYGSTLSNSNTKGVRFRDNGMLWGDGALRTTLRDFSNVGSFKMATVMYNRPAESFNYLNTVQGTQNNTAGAVVAGEEPLTFLAGKDGGTSFQHYKGQAAFYGTIRAGLTPAQYLAFNTLYKDTLGAGLGLP